MAKVKVYPSEGFGAHIRSVEELATEVEAVRGIAETAAGGGVEEAPVDGNSYHRENAGWVVDVPFDVSTINIVRVLDATSSAGTQYPTGTGEANRRQIEFGPAQHTGAEPVQMDATGSVTFNQGGLYRIKVALQFGRAGSGGSSYLSFRVLVNGTQAGRSVTFTLDNADSLSYFENDEWIYFPAGTVLTFEIMRDPIGNNSGGLKSFSPTGSWNDAPTAALRVQRLEVL